MRRLVFASLMLVAACSANAKTQRPPVADRAAGAAADGSPVRLGDASDGTLVEAFDLLARSAADSCASCVRDLRRRAFDLLDARFRPGTIVTSDSASPFLRAPDDANALIVPPRSPGDPELVFRFHTSGDRLVGIAESSLTQENLAARCHAAPEGTPLRASLEIVSFDYGDGAAFLYQPSVHRLQVHCRLSSIEED